MAGAAGGMTANPMQQASMAQQGALMGTAMAGMYRPGQVQTQFNAPMVGTSGAVPMVGTGGTTPSVGTSFGYSPVSGGAAAQQVSTGGTTPSVKAGSLIGSDIAAYQNPYTEQVIRANEADILRGAQMGINALDTAASRAGAFGGSRHGVALGEYGRGIAEQLAQSSAGLRQAGFQQAQQAAQFDIGQSAQAQMANQQAAANDLARQLQAQGMNQQAAEAEAARRLQAGQLNQAAGLQAQGLMSSAQMANQQAAANDLARQLQAQGMNQSTAMQVAQRQLQANLANQSAIQQAQNLGMQGQQFNVTSGLQGAQQGLQAAGQLAGLGAQSFGYGQAIQNQMASQGAQQQALQQALIDAAKGQFAGYTGQPASTLGYVSSALGATPVPQTQTTSKQPGLFDYLTLAASTFGGK